MKISSGGSTLECRDDLLGARLDQRMVAIGLIAQQVVDEEMACRAIQPRVEMERALPAPDVQARIVPDRGAPGELAAHVAQDDPLPAPLVSNGQLLGRHQQVVADLKKDGRSDRRLSERRTRRPPARSVSYDVFVATGPASP